MTGVVFEGLFDPADPEPIDLVANEETVIKFGIDNSEDDSKSSESFEDPLEDFLANSSGTGDSSSDDDESVSGEVLNPIETIKIEGPIENIKIDAPAVETIKVDIIPDKIVTPEESESYELDGTCLPTEEPSESDENGTCLPTAAADEEDDEEEEAESDEVPQIIIKKTIITSDDKEFASTSSETPDMIINPFLVVPDVEEIIKPNIEDDDESNIASDELAFNFIDSNDVAKHSEEYKKRTEEYSDNSARFVNFMRGLMSVFGWGSE